MSIERMYAQLIDDFEAQYAEELHSKKGEIVKILYQIDNDWVYAKLLTSNKLSGMIPLSYLKLIHISDNIDYNASDLSLYISTSSFLNYQKDDLDFEPGELIIGQKQIDENWMFGYYLNNPTKQGIFPLTHVCLVSQKVNKTQTNEYCVVIYDFIPENSTDLGCFKGEYLKIIERLSQDWLKCENVYFKEGNVPFNFVTLVTEEQYVKNLYNKNLTYEKSRSLILFEETKQTPLDIKSKSLLPEQFKQKPPTPPKPKYLNKNSTSLNPEETKNNSIQYRNRHDRIMVINELIDTEKAYYNELKSCFDLFMNESNLPADFNKFILFDKLKHVIDFSKSLIDSIDSELNLKNNDFDKINLGFCLLKNINDMKHIYAQYARSHNDIALIIKKYESNPEINEFINSKLKSAKEKFLVASLPTILIKPVQRIFKYPLFLTRLLKDTEKTHLDYENLKNASVEFSIMLEYINEYKRRQDLVFKYLNQPNLNEQTDLSIVGLVKKINLKTIKKKSNRFTIQLTNALGIYNKHVQDENFDQIESKYRLVEKTLREYFNDLNAYLTHLKDLLDGEKNIFTHLLFIYDDDFKTFSKFESSSNKRRSVEFHNYMGNLLKFVLNPVKTIVNGLNGPNKLINKRADKLLDYENAILNHEAKLTSMKELEENLEKTKKDYVAMNLQLVEELPLLNDKIFQILIKTAEIFFKLTRDFLSEIKLEFKNDVQTSQIDLNGQSSTSLLTKLNNITSNLNIRQSFINIDSESSLFNYPIQSEEQKQKIFSKFPIDKIYIVTQKYIPNEKLCQLKQNINDLVGLKIPYDPAGQKHIWFVDNGNIEGFIPSNALSSYKEFYNDSNLISFEDKFCIALYDFKSNTTNMLDLRKGEIYKVVKQMDEKDNDEWWLVEFNSNLGYVPKSYVKILD